MCRLFEHQFEANEIDEEEIKIVPYTCINNLTTILSPVISPQTIGESSTLGPTSCHYNSPQHQDRQVTTIVMKSDFIILIILLWITWRLEAEVKYAIPTIQTEAISDSKV